MQSVSNGEKYSFFQDTKLPDEDKAVLAEVFVSVEVFSKQHKIECEVKKWDDTTFCMMFDSDDEHLFYLLRLHAQLQIGMANKMLENAGKDQQFKLDHRDRMLFVCFS